VLFHTVVGSGRFCSHREQEGQSLAPAAGSALGRSVQPYLNNRHWGRMLVRVSPYFPFSARVCLNQHHWLARRMQQENIDFQQTTNAFLRCPDPQRLQELADSLTAHDLLVCGRK